MQDEISMTPAGVAACAPALRSEPEALSFRSSLLLAAVLCLSIAHRHTESRADDVALALLVLAGLLLMAATLSPSGEPLTALRARVTLPALAGISAYSFYHLWALAPIDMDYSPWLLVAASLAGVGLVREPAIERWRIPVFLAVYVFVALARIHTPSAEHSAVWVAHREAINSLVHGHNPYASSFPYAPVSFYFTLPGQVLGDYRYGVLASMVLAGACMAYARPSGFGAIAAALWLYSPRGLDVLENGWIEPVLVMLVALFLFCLARGWKIGFIPLGLLLVSKPYLAFFIPLLWLLPLDDGQPHPHWRLIGRALAVGALVSLPFIAIDPAAFFASTRASTQWLGFASLLPTIALALWRCERSFGGFATALALVSLGFFVLSKQAFGNNYFFTMGVSCCALAYASHDLSRPAA